MKMIRINLIDWFPFIFPNILIIAFAVHIFLKNFSENAYLENYYSPKLSELRQSTGLLEFIPKFKTSPKAGKWFDARLKLDNSQILLLQCSLPTGKFQYCYKFDALSGEVSYLDKLYEKRVTVHWLPQKFKKFDGRVYQFINNAETIIDFQRFNQRYEAQYREHETRLFWNGGTLIFFIGLLWWEIQLFKYCLLTSKD